MLANIFLAFKWYILLECHVSSNDVIDEVQIHIFCGFVRIWTSSIKGLSKAVVDDSIRDVSAAELRSPERTCAI